MKVGPRAVMRPLMEHVISMALRHVTPLGPIVPSLPSHLPSWRPTVHRFTGSLLSSQLTATHFSTFLLNTPPHSNYVQQQDHGHLH